MSLGCLARQGRHGEASAPQRPAGLLARWRSLAPARHQGTTRQRPSVVEEADLAWRPPPGAPLTRVVTRLSWKRLIQRCSTPCLAPE